MLKIYNQITFGYHIMKTYEDIFETKRSNDYVQLIYHHLLTILLYVGTYKLNYLGVATIIIYALDLSDLFISLSRIFIETNLKIFTIIFGVMMFFVFMYCRTIVFPLFFYYGMHYYPL
jgi:hypothetical protein